MKVYMKVMPSKTWSKTNSTQVTSLLQQDGNKKFRILAKWEKTIDYLYFLFIHQCLTVLFVCIAMITYLSARKAVFLFSCRL